MKIEKVVSFNSPSGCFRAQIGDARTMVDGKGAGVRIVFDLLSVQHRTKEFKAAITYRPENSDELIAVLEALVDVTEVIGEDGSVKESGLQLLVGLSCDIEIVHVHNSKFPHPFCKVVQVTRPGELVRNIA